MSPELAAFDQVYRRLRLAVMSGSFPPALALNTQRIATEIGVSVSPVRDAMERLVGERLLATRPGGGFQMPNLDEAEARNLYLWHSYLVRGAIHAVPVLDQGEELLARLAVAEPGEDELMVDVTTRFFDGLVEAGNPEHRAAIRAAGDRLHTLRLAEAQLRGRESELERLITLTLSGAASALKAAIGTYHRRRVRHLRSLLQTLYASRSAETPRIFSI